jgi:hypothetical protein
MEKAMSRPDEQGLNGSLTEKRKVLGHRANSSFQFLSQDHQTEWLRRAYRQSVNPRTWELAPVVDSKTDTVLRAMPEKAGGRYFVGPDGQYRIIGKEQREPTDVTEHRRQYVNTWLDTLPKKQQTTWRDLADLPNDHPHPGENEQISKWQGTDKSHLHQTPPVLVAEAPVFRFKPGIIDAPVVEFEPKPAIDGGGRSVGTNGGRSVAGGGTSGLPPTPVQPTTQRRSVAHAEETRENDILTSLFGSNDDMLQAPPVLNFDTPKTRPYPSMPSVLDTSKPAPALGLTAGEMQNIPWMALDQKLREQDTYSPYNNQIPLRQQPSRSHARSPLAAAQEALDAVHETHLAKGRDWNQELPGHPEAAKAEFENALEATTTEGVNMWTARKEGIPTAIEIEQIRQYAAPRIAEYFPESMRTDLLKRDEPSATLPAIKNGAQGVAEFMTALTFGEIKEITVDGQKIELSEIGTQQETATETKKRSGSHGAFFVKRFNYLVGQEVQQMLKDCPEVDSGKAEVVNGPKTPTADGQGFEPFTENTVQDPRRSGVKDSMRSDIAIRLVYNGQDCIFHINSVDMSGPYNADKREQRNFDRGVENARALLDHFKLAESKWGDRIAKMTLSQRNALAMIPKPATDDETEFQRILKDFMKRLDCASIIAECEKGAGYLDTLSTPGMTVQ